MKRLPVVAGKFYSASSAGLLEEVKRYVDPSAAGEKAVGIVSPHAGLVYSGAVAGAVYSRILAPRTFVLIGPNHSGAGRPVSIMGRGEWEIPTGVLKIDDVLAGRIMDNADIIEQDVSAHLMEHSLEVQMPFIRYCFPDSRIVPITMMSDSLDYCVTIGEAVAGAVRDTEYPVTIVASTDMTHYESDSLAREKDRKAIDRVMALDPEGLYRTVIKERISMCGFAPATTMLYAAKQLKAREADLVKYMTSGETSGDYEHVVGYAGIIVR